MGTLRGQTVEITATLLNVLNFLNQDRGQVRYANLNQVRLLDVYGYVTAEDVGTEIAGPPISAEDIGKPVVGFNPVADRDDLFNTAPLSSRFG